MVHGEAEVLCSAKVSSKVPAAPWDPTTVVTRSRAAQTDPAGTDEEVVEADVEELAVEAVAPEVGVVVWGDEQAASPSAAAATTVTAALHRTGRRGGEGLRS
jgi:hypothetical protein